MQTQTTRRDIRKWVAETKKLNWRLRWLAERGYPPKPYELERYKELKSWIRAGNAQLDAAAARKPAPIGKHAELARVDEQYTSLIALVERLAAAVDAETVPEEALALRLQLEEARHARERVRVKRMKIRKRIGK